MALMSNFVTINSKEIGSSKMRPIPGFSVVSEGKQEVLSPSCSSTSEIMFAFRETHNQKVLTPQREHPWWEKLTESSRSSLFNKRSKCKLRTPLCGAERTKKKKLQIFTLKLILERADRVLPTYDVFRRNWPSLAESILSSSQLFQLNFWSLATSKKSDL